MWTTLRHLLSILLLPFMVVVVVPGLLLTGVAAADSRWDLSSEYLWVPRLAGAASLLAGLMLFSWCVYLFARIGEGTLAPWDPTRHLISVGPYRHVRNPMISGVAMMLAGEALQWGSRFLGLWGCAFVIVNHLYFVLLEEPGLERRFGAPYRAYKATVPRWVPRLKRHDGDGTGQI